MERLCSNTHLHIEIQQTVFTDSVPEFMQWFPPQGHREREREGGGGGGGNNNNNNQTDTSQSIYIFPSKVFFLCPKHDI